MSLHWLSEFFVESMINTFLSSNLDVIVSVESLSDSDGESGPVSISGVFVVTVFVCVIDWVFVSDSYVSTCDDDTWLSWVEVTVTSA